MENGVFSLPVIFASTPFDFKTLTNSAAINLNVIFSIIFNKF